MNKELVVAIAKLLNVDGTILTAAIEKEDGNNEIITKFYETNNVYSLEDIKKLTSNAVNNKFEELEKGEVSKGEIPQKLYEKIGASFLESKEKKIAKAHGIDDYSGIMELVDKVVESKTSGKGGDDDQIKLKDEQIVTLKSTISKLELDKTEGIKGAEDKFNSQLIKTDSDSAFKEFSSELDYDSESVDGADSVLSKQTKLLKNAFENNYGIIRKNDKNIVVKNDEEKTPIVDNLGDPKPILAVVKEFATEYGFKLKEAQSGGRGSGDSKSHGTIKGSTFNEFLDAQEIAANTDEADKAYVDWKAANPN